MRERKNKHRDNVADTDLYTYILLYAYLWVTLQKKKNIQKKIQTKIPCEYKTSSAYNEQRIEETKC